MEEQPVDNPFQRRATEFLRDDEAFLAIVSPEPVTFFLRKPGEARRLYDRLVLMRGTPGSGKTTLARLFEYPSLAALLRNSSVSTYQALVAALSECGAVKNEQPTILGCRLPLETDYREFWECPYPDALKLRLMAALIQARAVLGWLRHLTAAGVEPSDVEIVPRADAEAIVEAIGGVKGEQVAARARAVEKALYLIMGALIAPAETELPAEATAAYQPFDIIDYVRVQVRSEGNKRTFELRPLAILDDAHVLHPTQFRALQRWLARRELRIARWMIARFDVLLPQEALAAVTEDRKDAAKYAGLSQDREIEVILLQSSGPRRENRTNFRRMAKDMAGRYLRRMPLLSTRDLVVLGDLLSDEEATLSASECKRLRESVDAAQRKLQVADSRRDSFAKDATEFLVGGKPVTEDIALAMVAVMLYRYDKRRNGPSIFGPDDDQEPSRPVMANPSVYEAAKLHLLQKFDRPYYYGIDDLCDASSENAEQFLQLAAKLVETSATQIIRSKPASLTATVQHQILRKRGDQIIEGWNFPQHLLVRRLVTAIALRCVEVTAQPNGWLTPNAFGIKQEEFDVLPDSHPGLAHVLQFAVAYNAVTLVPHYPCKSKEWCLVELGGMVVLKHGLTLKRGGFVESTPQELATMLEEPRP
jgi:hypothetical protein